MHREMNSYVVFYDEFIYNKTMSDLFVLCYKVCTIPDKI